jgi:hypothetical protein
MGWALRLKAARGDRATVATSDHAAILDSGLAPSDIEEIDQTISALRQSHFGHKPPGKILRLLDECGASQSPGDIAQAQSIVHRGQAAALMAVDERWSGRYTEDDRLIDGIVNDGSRTAVSASAVAAVEGPNQSTLREAVAPSTPLMVPSPDATPPAASEPVVSPAIASIVVLTERLIEEKAVLEEWRQKTQDRCVPSQLCLSKCSVTMTSRESRRAPSPTTDRCCSGCRKLTARTRVTSVVHWKTY